MLIYSNQPLITVLMTVQALIFQDIRSDTPQDLMMRSALLGRLIFQVLNTLLSVAVQLRLKITYLNTLKIRKMK